MTKQTKQVYETPTTESLELRFEGGIMKTSGDVDANSWTPGESNWFDDAD
jgi:hypothetical protein